MFNILLTSFQTWLPHQISNASDDLLIEIQKEHFPHLSLGFARQLPVEITPAADQVITKIQIFHPDMVICCGMAENRSNLTIESNATWHSSRLYTSINLAKIMTGLTQTTISHDAGKFVCEGLYYQILNYLKHSQSSRQCLFVHVPILTADNVSGIVTDFQRLLKNCRSLP